MALGRREASRLQKILVVLPCVFGLALGTPLLLTGGHGSLFNHRSSGNSSGVLGFLGPLLNHNSLLLNHHKERRSTHELHKPTVEFTEKQPVMDGLDAQQLMRVATFVPLETLNLVRRIAVPIVDTTLTIPGNVIQQLLLNNGSEPSLAAMAGIPPNATATWFNTTHITETLERALHFNASSLNETSEHLHKFPRNLAYQIGNSSFYNSTSEAAHSAAHMGERLLLTPMAALLALAVPPSMRGNDAKHGQYPPSLNADHLRRHLDNLRNFFGAAAHHNASAVEAAEAPVKNEIAVDAAKEPKPESAGQSAPPRPTDGAHH